MRQLGEYMKLAILLLCNFAMASTPYQPVLKMRPPKLDGPFQGENNVVHNNRSRHHRSKKHNDGVLTIWKVR